MNASGHPQLQELSSYVSGTLPESDASAVARHLADCPTCETTVQQIEAKSDTMLSGLRGKPPAEPYLNETEYRRAAKNAAAVAGTAGAGSAKPAAAAKVSQPSTKAPSPQLGPYKLLAKLGEGGMGAVFKAQHEHLEKLVAIKVLPKAAMNDKAAVDRFRREMKAVGRLHHPNIVTAHDAGEARGVHFLVMEYVEGSDLSSLVKKQGPLKVDVAASYVLQAARGLAFAHAKGIVHRDIKPANLLVDGEGTVKILDMGLARLDGDAATKDAKDGLTQTGQVMGTVDYMAPEQAFDTHRADGKADVYSLGCTLYRLVTGKNAYDGDTLVQKILAHRENPIPSLCATRVEAPAALDSLYQRMMAKRPDDRPTMAEVARELEAIQLRGTTIGNGDTAGIVSTATDDGLAKSVVLDLGVSSKPTRAAISPAKKPATAGKSGRGKKPPLKLIAAGFGGFAMILGGVLLYIGNTKIEVPDGATASVEIDPSGKPNVRITLPTATPSTVAPSTVAPSTVATASPRTTTPLPTAKPAAAAVTPSTASGPVEFQGKRYQAFREVLSWHAARDRCVAEGGHLAIVRSPAEQTFLIGLLKAARMDAAWIGATDEQNEGEWVWVDRSPCNFKDWDQYQPNNKPPGEHYAAIVVNFQGRPHNGRWSDQPAVATGEHPTIGFICQWDRADGSAIFPSPPGEEWAGARGSPPPGDYALRFMDGASVEVPTLYDAIDPAGPLTVECWLAPGYYLPGQAEQPGSQLVKFLRFGGEVPCLGVSGGPFYLCIDNSGNFDFRIYTNEMLTGLGGAGKPPLALAKPGERGTKSTYITGGGSNKANQRPIHLACIYRQGRAEFYVAGKRYYQKDLPPVTLTNTDRPFAIGGRRRDDNVWFHGFVNEVRVSKTVRYDTDFTPPMRFEPDAETVALYHFDEGEGDVLRDASGNGHEGKILGAEMGRADGSAIPAAVRSKTAGPAADLSGSKVFDLLTDDENSQWSEPERLGVVNTAAGEYAPSISADANVLVFHAARPDSLGRKWDLYMAQRSHIDEPFPQAVNLGPAVNSAEEDYAPSLSADGLRLLFSSRRSANGDIYESTRASRDEPFGPARLLEGGINTLSSDSSCSQTADGRVVVVSSTLGAPGDELYQIERTDERSPFSPRRALSTVNGPHDDRYPWLSADGLVLVFNEYEGEPAANRAAKLWAAARKNVADAFGPRVPLTLRPPAGAVSGIHHPSFSGDGGYVVYSALIAGQQYPDLWMSRCVRQDGVTTPVASDSPAAPSGDWQSLFDGKTFAGWSSVGGKGIQLDWKIEEGALVATGGKALIATAKEYADYELEWEWQVGPGANGGVHYVWHGQTVESPYDGTLVAAPEYQIVDNEGHPNGKRPESTAGSMFGMFAPTEQAARKVGQWNQARLVVRGADIEHWLNGKMVLRYTLGGEAWKAQLAKARRGTVPEFGKPGPGRIALQSNTGIVRYRNIRIRPLAATANKVSSPADPAFQTWPLRSLTRSSGRPNRTWSALTVANRF